MTAPPQRRNLRLGDRFDSSANRHERCLIPAGDLIKKVESSPTFQLFNRDGHFPDLNGKRACSSLLEYGKEIHLMTINFLSYLRDGMARVHCLGITAVRAGLNGVDFFNSPRFCTGDEDMT